MTDKRKCPKDADQIPDGDCPARIKDFGGGEWLCTRTKGHKGKHHAHDGLGNCCKVWK